MISHSTVENPPLKISGMKFSSNLLSLTLMFLADAVAKAVAKVIARTSVAISVFVKGRMTVAPLVCGDAAGHRRRLWALRAVC
jgi:hypothetical protein